MTIDLTCHIKPYIQPFERRLALLELASLAGAVPMPASLGQDTADTFRVASAVAPDKLVARLAYWETVQRGAPIWTTQILREATTNVVRNGTPIKEIREQLPFDGVVPAPNRRALRYGTHGIHEYRGKFFPQLVRALFNVADVSSRGVVCDPMCGSGTTLVEASLSLMTGIGSDLNPLSVFMARTKTALLSISPESLARAYTRTREHLLSQRDKPRDPLAYFHTLPKPDQGYLAAWFSDQVLRDLDVIAQLIQKQRAGAIRDFHWLALSNILRRVSWQKVDDLRVRKEVRLDEEIDPIKEYLEEIGRSVRTVLALLYQQGPIRHLGKVSVAEADACSPPSSWRRWVGRVDAIVTSPPYATALPYLDTDRLSLSYLGLLPRSEQRARDRHMIGNREITDRMRREYWHRFSGTRRELPHDLGALISRIERLNQNDEAGFRRRNLGALLWKYFTDMKVVLSHSRSLLRRGGHAYVVVGDNHTTAGGVRINIPTAQHLATIAESVGLSVREMIPMEMLTSRDIFRRNAVASEWIVCLHKKR